MSLTFNEWVVTEVTSSIPIPFSFINESDVHLYVDGVELVQGVDYTITTPSTIQATTPPTEGSTVLLRRETNATTKAVDFQSGAMLTESDLDTAFDQVFNLAQETKDVAIHDFNEATDAFNKVGEFLPEINTVADDLGHGAITHIDYGDLTSTTATPSSDSIIHNVYLRLDDVTTLNANKTNIDTVAGINGDVTTVAGIDAAVTALAIPANLSAIQYVDSASQAITDAAALISTGALQDITDNLTVILASPANAATATTKAGEASASAVNALASEGLAAGSVVDATAQVALAAGQVTLASDQVGLATAQVALAAGQVVLASDEVALAAGQVTLATTQAGIATTKATEASVSASDAATTLATFQQQYHGALAAAPSANLNEGDLYFDTTSDTMKVYGTGGWQAAGSTVNGTARRESFTATANQTTFTVAGGFDSGFVDVFMDGVKLHTSDFTDSSGTDIVLTVGASVGQLIDIIAYGTFVVSNMVTTDINGLQQALDDIETLALVGL